MKMKRNNLEQFLNDYQPDFKPFFETRLKAKLESFRNEATYERLYNRFFKRFVLSGFAAIAAILIVIFVMNGSLGLDALLGVKDLSVENSIVMSLADL